MLEDAFSILEYAITEVFALFDSLADRFGFAFFLIGFFTIFTITRLLLGPFIGGVFKAGVSDQVKRYKNGGSKSSGSSEGE